MSFLDCLDHANTCGEYASQEEEVLPFQSPQSLSIVIIGISPQIQTSGMVLL
jgi:hypothetical protein